MFHSPRHKPNTLQKANQLRKPIIPGKAGGGDIASMPPQDDHMIGMQVQLPPRAMRGEVKAPETRLKDVISMVYSGENMPCLRGFEPPTFGSGVGWLGKLSRKQK